MPKAASRQIKASSKTTRKKFIIHAGNFCIKLGEKTKVMGILNLTPDSFSGDGCLAGKKYILDEIIHKAQRMILDGADIIDVGGESTRPGSRSISAKEEIRRIIPVIRTLAKTIKKPISVDTYKEAVAKVSLDAGATIINNIMGVNCDRKFLKMCKSYNAAIVLMHMLRKPRTMQRNIQYGNLIGDIVEELKKSIEKCLEIGIKSDKIIIDPGIGFGKTVEHNLEIIERLADFSVLNRPILIGTSRKSFIGKVLKREVSERLMGTAASVAVSVLNGAHVVRVHDVKEIKDVVKMIDTLIM